MRPPIPLYVLVIIGVIIVGLILLVLSLLHIVDLTFLGDGVVWFLTAPLMWGSASWYAAVTFYILGFGAVAFICFLIAKRRYLISQKILVSSTRLRTSRTRTNKYTYTCSGAT
jgi:hypothetical protein